MSVRGLVGPDGLVHERLSYDAYGTLSSPGGLLRPGDVDGDGDVDLADEAALSALAGPGTGIDEVGYDVACDLNHDGRIDLDDEVLQAGWFGTAPLVVGRISDPSGPDNAIGYGAYVYSHEARASLARHRWYDPLLGRWWQRDPAGYADGMSLYEYVRSGPIGGWDPMGLEDVTAWEVTKQMPSAVISTLATPFNWAYDKLMGDSGESDASRDFKKAKSFDYRCNGSDIIGGRDRSVYDDFVLDVHNIQVNAVTQTAAAAEAAMRDAYGPGLIMGAAAAPVVGKVVPKVHGNKVDDAPATLYAKYDKDGNFRKWGITKHEDPTKRYTKSQIAGGEVRVVERGPRRDMIKKERELVETQPGPDNREPWAGKRKQE